MSYTKSIQNLAAIKAQAARAQPERVLMPSQVQAQGLIGAWLNRTQLGARSWLGHATGMGKTVTTASFVSQHMSPSAAVMQAANSGLLDRVFWFTHRDELVTQSQTELQSWAKEPVDVEKADRRAGTARIIVGSIQSLDASRLAKLVALAAGNSLVVFDEAHHCDANTWAAICDGFSGKAKFLNLTATPWLSQVDNLIDSLGECLDYHSTRDAIDMGLLTPYAITDWRMDSKVTWTATGELDGESLRKLTEPAAVDALVDKIAPLAQDNTSLIFAASVVHGFALADRLSRKLGCAVPFIDATTPAKERQQALADFQSGKVPVLVNYDVYTEGTDIPAINQLFILRPTQEHHKYVQMLGRGLRRLLDVNGQPLLNGGKLAKPCCRVFSLTPPLEPEERHSFVSLPDELHGGRWAALTLEKANLLSKRSPTPAETLGGCFYPKAQLEAWLVGGGPPPETAKPASLGLKLPLTEERCAYWPRMLAKSQGKAAIELVIQSVEDLGLEYLPRGLPESKAALNTWREEKRMGYRLATVETEKLANRLARQWSPLASKLLTNPELFPIRTVRKSGGTAMLVGLTNECSVLVNGPDSTLCLTYKNQWKQLRPGMANQYNCPVDKSTLPDVPERYVRAKISTLFTSRMQGELPRDSALLHLALLLKDEDTATWFNQMVKALTGREITGVSVRQPVEQPLP